MCLISITGVTIYESDITGDKMMIDMEKLPQGLYLLNVQTKEGAKVTKVMKQ